MLGRWIDRRPTEELQRLADTPASAWVCGNWSLEPVLSIGYPSDGCLLTIAYGSGALRWWISGRYGWEFKLTNEFADYVDRQLFPAYGKARRDGSLYIRVYRRYDILNRWLRKRQARSQSYRPVPSLVTMIQNRARKALAKRVIEMREPLAVPAQTRNSACRVCTPVPGAGERQAQAVLEGV